MEEEKIHQLALGLISGVGNVNAKYLISYCGSATDVFRSKRSRFREIPGIGPKTIETIARQETVSEAEKILASCERSGIEVLHYTDQSYPSRLKSIMDAPNILYKKGKGDADAFRTIGIVGTRNATDYGKETTGKIVKDLRPLNVSVISGLAYGIDIQAHKAALTNGMPTVAVLAGGLDKIYPFVHKSTANDILENGCLLSENPPGTTPEAHFFPARNRIIAGLSDAVIVVEAAKKGGALITADIADSYNKAVFAVPGNLGNAYSEGCNCLIRNQKANLYTGAEVLDFHLSWTKAEADKANESAQAEMETLTDEEKTVFMLLKNTKDGIAIDALAWESRININQLAGILLNLEFQGLVKSLPGKKYRAS